MKRIFKFVPTTLKIFIEEFRLMCDDSYGDANEAHLEAVGQMNKRGLDIPIKYEYNSGKDFPGYNEKGTCPDSRWYQMFEDANTEDLMQIAEYTFRYLQMLVRKGYLKEDYQN